MSGLFSGSAPFSKRSAPLDRDSRLGSLLSLAVCAAILILVASCSTLNNTPTQSSTSTGTSAPVRLGPTSTPTQLPPTRPTSAPSPTLRPIDPISASDWTRGADDPRVQVLVYSDFQCPYCAELSIVIDDLLERHPDDFQFVFRQFPLVSIHDKAFIAAQAAEAAGAQGQFWSMHDLLFAQRAEWVELSPSEFLDWVLTKAETFDLDFARFERELLEGKYATAIEDAYVHAVQSGIPGTPFIFLNGSWFRLNPTLTNMEAAVRLEILGQQQFASPPELEIDPEKLYFAHLQLTQGTVDIQLLPAYAPRTVANFIFLAQSGWYDNNPIYTVLPDRLIESGDPSGTGFGNPGYTLPDEINTQISFNQPGMIAMSSSGPDTNGSRYFISLTDLSDLNGTRTIFGRVISGLDILRELSARDALEDLLTQPESSIQHVEIEIR
jgi:cyclophilin family peptidyl-prolyl cis-trans isomerase/protein-disulfide isomerase